MDPVVRAVEPAACPSFTRGHGHLDMAAYDRFLSGRMEDHALPQSRLDQALTTLP
ncbi:hypothetical protein [Actinomadura sp. B10D3]|uniref:hypothetical protein n=1 Tax=Actinomadura sp. B10D3 TaxID=3153557 RepID=UPI00325D3F44